MEELLLLENPMNPWYGQSRRHARASELGWRRGHKMRRNPGALAIPGIPKNLLGGVDVMDVAAAAGGAVAVTMVPNMIFKTPPTDTVGKILKLAAGVGTALGAGYLVKGISPNAAKFAIAGGLAAVLVQALGTFTTVKLGEPMQLGGPVGHLLGRLGESRFAPNVDDSGIQTSVT